MSYRVTCGRRLASFNSCNSFNHVTVSLLSTQHLAQMPQFFVHLGRAGDGLRDLLAEKLMVAPAHSLHRFFHCLLRHAHFPCDLAISLVSGSFDEKRLQSRE